MVKRKNVSSGSPLEQPIGFSRAVRIGNVIAVSGTAPLSEDGETICHGDVYGQTLRCLTIATAAIQQAGGGVGDVLRTRVMLKDASTWKDAARAHGEFFGEVRPACTFVEVSRFIDVDWLVEVEVDAVVGELGEGER